MLVDDFIRSNRQSQAVPSTVESSWFAVLLVLVRLARCYAVFLVADLLQMLHVFQLVFALKLVATSILVPFQKPFGDISKFGAGRLVKVAKLSIFNSFIEILWMFGIAFCGPIRSTLIFDIDTGVLALALSAITKSGRSPAKLRGSLLLVVGVLVLFLVDSSGTPAGHSHSLSHHHHHVDFWHHIFGWASLPLQKIGVLLVLISVVLRVAYDHLFRRAAQSFDGAKQLYSLITAISTSITAPLAIFTLRSGQFTEISWLQFLATLSFCGFFLFVGDFYTEKVCLRHLTPLIVSRLAPITSFVGTILVGFVVYSSLEHPHVHLFSLGLILPTCCFSIASIILTSPNVPRVRAGQFIGISERSGLPLYVTGEDFLQRTSHSISTFAKNTLRQILLNSDSRRIFYFLCANLAFCGIEFLYGFWTNSLGLISDGFHMFFDCSALVMGLVASVMSHWTSTRLYPFGYGRVEVMSGFINALFLVVIAFFIFLEALSRLYDPPEVHTDKLLFVSVAGLIVNLFGIFAFHGSHGHSHGGGSHGHSHGGGGEDKKKCDGGHHGHSHGHDHKQNANMQGVFLHVLADTLGSVFVIISSILIENFGWNWVDPFCSLILAGLIFGSVIPLLKDSSSVLLQRVPDELEEELELTLQKILSLQGVASYSSAHCWQLKSETYVLTLHVQVSSSSANQQHLLQRILKTLSTLEGVTHIAIQIENDVFFHRITALCPNYAPSYRMLPSKTLLQNTLMVKAI